MDVFTWIVLITGAAALARGFVRLVEVIDT